jgi:hypothetical protein
VITPPLTDPEVLALVDEWQKILRIEDWDLTIDILPHGSFDDGSLAGTSANYERRAARLRILQPSQHPDDEDFEQTLVHELLHVSSALIHSHKVGLMRGLRNTVFEGFIDQLAVILVRMKRAGELRYLEGQRYQIDSLTKRLTRAKLVVGNKKD